jgi:hypothetical protein
MLPITPLLRTLRRLWHTLSRLLRWLVQADATYHTLMNVLDWLSG